MQSFYLNFILLRGLLLALNPDWLLSFVTHNTHRAIILLIYSFLAHGLVFIWQSVGLYRACNQHLKCGGNTITIWGIYCAMLICLMLSLTHVLDHNIPRNYRQTLNNIAIQLQLRQQEKYRLTVVSEDNTVSLNGSIELGAGELLIEILDQYPQIDQLKLTSGGGNIFAARGLARIIIEHNLNTHIDQACSSACTLIFAAGSHRTMKTGAKIGFHQYRLLNRYTNSMTDIRQEQDKDRLFLQSRGVTPDFLDHIFAMDSDQIWYPAENQLLKAGVLHQALP